ncbi:MAG: 6-phosphogluconolactonase, partial [Nitrospinae bacterium]|nr:6-phosphogluconolactonase [Nitrospinota bacterium]
AVYQVLALPEFKSSIPWNCIHFFWGDERCVPPDHEDSNYRMARETLLDPLNILQENIHRIRGENDPETEAARYAGEIKNNLKPQSGKTPRFDWILLGLGTDGHTASLFPGAQPIEDHSGLCVVAIQPQSGQKRITLTNRVLNHAKRVSFIVTGKSKGQVVADILNESPKSKNYPAAHVLPQQGTLEWFLDANAATKLKESY